MAALLPYGGNYDNNVDDDYG